jgi:hypothetical protein
MSLAGLARAQEEHVEAQFEAVHWDRVCATWKEVMGLKGWRERHPLDVYKVRQRRYWRRAAAVSGERLRQCFANATAEGRA